MSASKEVAMSRYALSLPQQLKQSAEELARQQGISLNQFILWAVAEKVGALSEGLGDPNFPGIQYRRGASGQPVPVLRGLGLRVETVVVCHHDWGLSVAQIAEDYGSSEARIKEALAFYQAHRAEIDASLQVSSQLEPAHG
jgi:uncharacterized protein (DUF433 family)